MANYSSISRILGAAIFSVGVTFILAAPVHASVNTDAREAAQVISESDTLVRDTLVRISANSSRQLRNQRQRRMLVPQQATGNQTAAGSLSNGTTQQPLLAPAGDEMKKILKNIPQPNCGGPQDIC